MHPHHRNLPILLLALGLLFSAAAWAERDPVEAGVAAYEAEQYERAYELLKPEAEEGDAEAQYYVALMYDQGEGVEVDREKATALFTSAAESGHTIAQIATAYSYLKGIGVDRDYEKAADWYRKAAENGDSAAQRSLGLRYKHGEGVKQDYEEAAKWFHRAAEQGDERAFYELGIAYRYGDGVEQDYVKAAHWNRKAMEAGYAHAKRMLAWQYMTGKGVEKDLGMAERLFRDLLSEDDAHDYFALGLLVQGEAREEDDESLFREAYGYFRTAAAEGHAKAMSHVAAHHSNGWGVERDNVEAHAWDLLSYEHGFEEALRLIEHTKKYAHDADPEAARARARELRRELGLGDGSDGVNGSGDE